MTASWILYSAFVGGLLAIAGNAIAGAVQRIGRPTRFVWAAAMLGMLALSFIALPSRNTASPSLSGIKVVQGRALIASSPQPSWLDAARGRIANAEQDVARAIMNVVPPVMVERFTYFWLGATIGIAALILGVYVAMTRRRLHWPRAELFGARIRLTPDIGPAVIGFTSPDIVVPSWLLGRSNEEQRLAIAHEGEHVAARDHLLLAVGWAVVAVMPWHPASWWMLTQLRLAIELDCDARVLKAGAAPRSYGQMLIDIADHCSEQRVLALALADRTSHLERRLLAMKTSRNRFGRTRATVLAAVGAAAVLVACESKLPTSADVEKADVASVSKAMLPTMEAPGHKTVYVIDGKPVDYVAATALNSDKIAQINVTKGDKVTKVDVTTRDNVAMLRERRAAGLPLAASRIADSSVTIRMSTEKGSLSEKRFDGIYVIDGVVATEKEFVALKLDPNKIESVTVLKGASAGRLYSDPAAVNGVISITTKK